MSVWPQTAEDWLIWLLGPDRYVQRVKQLEANKEANKTALSKLLKAG